jgi:hypothetical protein
MPTDRQPPEPDLHVARYRALGTAVVDQVSAHAPVEIGDTTQPDFKPQIKIPRWANQANASFRLVHPEPATVTYDAAAITYDTPSLTAKFYALDDVETDDGHEFEVWLKTKPASNVVTFTVQHKGGTWTKQPFHPHRSEHPEFHPDAYYYGTNPWGGERRSPERVVGSYVFYSETLQGDWSRAGGHNYRSGKILHVYRPWAQDATGRKVWCDLDLDERAGLLTITIPQDFLEAAVYPVLVDPTFGYSGTAASDDNIGGAHILCKATTTPANNGTLDSITIKGRIRNDGAAPHPNHAPAIYSDSAGAPANKLAAVDTAGSLYTGSDAEVTTALSYGSIASGTQYWLGSRQAQVTDYSAAGTGDDAWFKYDASGGAANLYYKVAVTETSWEATTTGFSNAANEKVYIYATFTASSASLSPGAGSLGLTGRAAIMAFAIGLAVGALGLTGLAPTVSVAGTGTTIAVPAGAVALSGQYVAPTFGGPSAGALTLAGLAPAAVQDDPTPLGVGSLAFTGRAPTLQYDIRGDLGAGALALSGQAPSLRFDLVTALPAGALTFGGLTPTVSGTGSVSPGAGSLTLSGAAPSLKVDIAIGLPAGAVTVNGLAPTVVGTGATSPAAGALTISGLAPTLKTDYVLALPSGSLTFSGQAPSIVGSGAISPGAGALTLTGGAPSLQFDLTLALGAGSLTCAGQTPTLVTPVVIAMSAGTFTWTGRTPSVSGVVSARLIAANSWRSNIASATSTREGRRVTSHE